MCIDIVEIWFRIVNGQISGLGLLLGKFPQFLIELLSRHTTFLFHVCFVFVFSEK